MFLPLKAVNTLFSSQWQLHLDRVNVNDISSDRLPIYKRLHKWQPWHFQFSPRNRPWKHPVVCCRKDVCGMCFIIIPRMALAWLDAGLFYFTCLSEDSFCVWLHLSRQLHPGHVGLNQQVCLYVRVIVFGVRHFVRHTVHELQYKQGIWLLTLLEKPVNNCIVPSLLPCSLKGRWKQ